MSQPQILPLTPGLLISMALRYDNGFASPCDWEAISNGDFSAKEAPQSVIEARQRITIDNMLEVYQKATKGLLSDPALLEEVIGQGFYWWKAEVGYRMMVSEPVLQYVASLVNGNVA